MPMSPTDANVPPCASDPARTGDRVIGPAHVIAAIPLLGVVVGQFQDRFELMLGPLSLAQAYHVAALAVVATIGLARLHRFPAAWRPVLPAVLCVAGSVVLSGACLLAEGRLSMETAVAAGQIAYWLVLWLTVLVVCTSARECRVILGGIVVTGMYMAASVVYLYVSKGQDGSIYEGFVGNAGGFHTAKGLTGILAIAGLAAVWLFRERSRLLGISILFLCLAGMLLTYQRAGQVGLALAVVWLAVWYGRRRRSAGWALYPVVILAMALLVMLATVGTEDLEKRWDDIWEGDKAGSGRVGFWKTAFEHYTQMDVLSQISGIGYTDMADAMERKHGARIHTHSDVLDFLLMFGAVGLAAFLVMHVVLLRMIWLSGSSAFGIAIALYLVMASQSALTGQALCTTAMSCYLPAITCVCLHPQDIAHTSARHVGYTARAA